MPSTVPSPLKYSLPRSLRRLVSAQEVPSPRLVVRPKSYAGRGGKPNGPVDRAVAGNGAKSSADLPMRRGAWERHLADAPGLGDRSKLVMVRRQGGQHLGTECVRIGSTIHPVLYGRSIGDIRCTGVSGTSRRFHLSRKFEEGLSDGFFRRRFLPQGCRVMDQNPPR